MRFRLSASIYLLVASMAIVSCDSSPDAQPKEDETEQTPNILFVIMDDVGADQMPSMGYGGLDAPAMPTIDSIADAGLRFRNTWSMPECSPGRSTLMTGRY